MNINIDEEGKKSNQLRVQEYDCFVSWTVLVVSCLTPQEQRLQSGTCDTFQQRSRVNSTKFSVVYVFSTSCPSAYNLAGCNITLILILLFSLYLEMVLCWPVISYDSYFLCLKTVHSVHVICCRYSEGKINLATVNRTQISSLSPKINVKFMWC